MADTYTTNLNLTKPEPGAAEDTWGISLNADLDSLDAIFGSGGTAVSMGAVTLDGLTVEAASNALIRISDSTSANQRLDLQHNGGVASIISGNNGAYGAIKLQAYNGTDTVDRLSINTSGDATFSGTVTSDGLVVNGEINGPPTNNLTIRSKYSATIDIDSDNNQTDRNFQVIHDGSKLLLKAKESGDISFYDDTGTTQGLFWDASGERLGIGTTSPSTTLHVADTSANITIQDSNSSGNTAAAKILFADSGTFGTIGTIGFAGNDDLKIENNHTGNILLSGGNVGIGTDSPQAKLHIDSTGDALQFTRTGQETYKVTHGTSGLYTLLGSTIAIGVTQNHDFGVYDNTGSQYAMFDGSTSRVGIGTSSPSSKLTVSNAGESNIDIEDSGGQTHRFFVRNSDKMFGIYDVNNTSTWFRYAGDATASNRKVALLENGGKVGIGTISPQDKLSIEGGNVSINNGSAFQVGGSISGNTVVGRLKNESGVLTLKGDSTRDVQFGSETNGTAMFIEGSNGNVGIGTTSPNYLLDVEGSGSAVRVNSTSGDSNIHLRVADTTSLNIINFGDSGSSTAGRILYRHTGDSMAFNVAGNEAVRIINGGNVGIGTSSPSGELHVKSASTNANFYLQRSIYDPWRLEAGSTYLTFSQNSGELMRIDSSGNVGIGTDAPSAKLDVLGDDTSGASITWKQGTRHSGYLYSDTSGVAIYDTNINNAGIYLASNNRMDFRVNGTERMRIDSSGDVQIGTTASIASATLTTVSSGNTHQVMRSSNASAGEYWRQEVDASNDFYLIDNTSTGVYITDGSTSWSGISDENLKENIVELTGVLDKVKDFRCVEYNLIADEDSSKKIGFIAQDWQEDYSEVVSQDNDGNLGIKYTETIPVLLKAIQEQQTLIESLEARITTLEG